MEKPTKIVFTDGEISFKDACIYYGVPFAWVNGVKYRLPLEKWISEKKT